MTLLDSLLDFYRYDFLIYAILGIIFLSLICGVLSPMIIARQYAFLGEAVGHSTFLSLILVTGPLQMMDGPLVWPCVVLITLMMVLFLAHGSYNNKLPSDTLIGIFLSSTLALGVLLHTLLNDNKGELLSFLFGNILLLESFDLIILFVLALGILLSFLLPLNKWNYFFYDQVSAEIAGLPTKFMHYFFFFVLTVTIVSAVKLAGTILTITLLLIPGATSYKLFKSMKSVYVFSILFSVITSVLGLILSNWKSLPPGASLALTQFSFFILFTLAKRVM